MDEKPTKKQLITFLVDSFGYDKEDLTNLDYTDLTDGLTEDALAAACGF